MIVGFILLNFFNTPESKKCTQINNMYVHYSDSKILNTFKFSGSPDHTNIILIQILYRTITHLIHLYFFYWAPNVQHGGPCKKSMTPFFPNDDPYYYASQNYLAPYYSHTNHI